MGVAMEAGHLLEAAKAPKPSGVATCRMVLFTGGAGGGVLW